MWTSISESRRITWDWVKVLGQQSGSKYKENKRKKKWNILL